MQRPSVNGHTIELVSLWLSASFWILPNILWPTEPSPNGQRDNQPLTTIPITTFIINPSIPDEFILHNNVDK